ncbi:MAG: Crp/Fnr family transcriptional regulator [Pseudomonadota bacterium]
MAIDIAELLPLNRCGTCPIRNRALCSVADDKALKDLNQISRRTRFEAGQTIMSEEAPVDFVGNVISGVVKLTKITPDGREQIVGLLFPSDFVGRTFADSSAFSAEAATDVELCCLQKPGFERILADHRDLEHKLLIDTLDELDAAREWMLLLGCKTAAEKIASFLLMLVRRAFNTGCGQDPPPNQLVFELPVSRADMAGYLGMAVETVSRQLSQLKADGVIRLVDVQHFLVKDLGRLAEIAGQEPPVYDDDAEFETRRY